jgi:hypothetical protein
VSGSSDTGILMSSGSWKSKWKRETDGGIFTVAFLAMNPDLSFNPFDDGRGGFYLIW